MPTNTSRTISGPGVPDLLEAVNGLLGRALGLQLPDGTDAANLVDRLRLMADVVGQFADGLTNEPAETAMAVSMAQAVVRRRAGTRVTQRALKLKANTRRILGRAGVAGRR